MSYCYEKGIPHSEFLSWLPEDRAKTLAYALESSERCQLCGTAQWEWDENPFAYEPVENFCRGCYLKGVAGEGSNSLPGSTTELVPVTEMSKARKKVLAMRRSKKDMGDQED